MNTGKLPGSITNVGQHAQAGRGVVQANEQPLKEQRKMPGMKAIRSHDYGDAAGQDSPAIEANVADRLLTRGHLSLASSCDQFDHLL
jgi:hypothetical protein